MALALLKLVTMLRLLAFMVLIYAGLAWIAERTIAKPDSKVKAFFRILCAPVAGPVARLLHPGAGRQRVLAVSTGAAAAVWVALVVLDEVLVRLR
jgi:uncharacterized protein YggT (Ycf19 family)